MAILASSSKGIKQQKPIILIYGAGGLGKDTFASGFDAPIFGDLEDGTGNLDVTRALLKTWDETWAFLLEVRDTTHAFKTLVLSGLDTLEQRLWDKIIKEDPKGAPNMVQAAGGYGNGYKLAIEYWGKMHELLHEIRAKNIGIVIVGHDLVYSYNDPATMAPYDRYRLKLHEGTKESAAKLWFDFADIVLFAKRKVSVAGGSMAMDQGKHYIYTQGRAAFDAKSRYDLPFEIPLNYKEFAAALMGKQETIEDVTKDILALAKDIKDAAKQEQIGALVVKFKGSLHDLRGIRENVKTLLQRS